MGGSRQPMPSESADTHYTISPKKKQSFREKNSPAYGCPPLAHNIWNLCPFSLKKGLLFFAGHDIIIEYGFQYIVDTIYV